MSFYMLFFSEETLRKWYDLKDFTFWRLVLLQLASLILGFRVKSWVLSTWRCRIGLTGKVEMTRMLPDLRNRNLAENKSPNFTRVEIGRGVKILYLFWLWIWDLSERKKNCMILVIPTVPSFRFPSVCLSCRWRLFFAVDVCSCQVLLVPVSPWAINRQLLEEKVRATLNPVTSPFYEGTSVTQGGKGGPDMMFVEICRMASCALTPQVSRRHTGIPSSIASLSEKIRITDYKQFWDKVWNKMKIKSFRLLPNVPQNVCGQIKF